MRDTRFDSRSSEWIGDLTVWKRQNDPDNAEQTEPIPDPAGGGNVENSGGTPENGTANTE